MSAVAASSPALRGTFVGRHTPSAPAAVVAANDANDAGAADAVAPQPFAGTQTYTTVAHPQRTSAPITSGPVGTVAYNDPAGNTQIDSPLASDGIPVVALEAYQNAANAENAADPACHIPWPLLAGIGRVESDHGRYGGAVLRADGTSSRPIIGIPLNGNGTEVVTDTDHGAIDGDPVYDRAVGPMQFIPSTWLAYGADGNGDGIKDPFNIFDAAAAAAHYLCVAGGDLSTTAGQTRAVLTYNHSAAYLAEVLALEHTYASGAPGLIIPAPPAVVPPVPVKGPGGGPLPPPVDPGPPLAVIPLPTPTDSSSSSSHRPSPAPSSAATSSAPAPSSSTPPPSSSSAAPSTTPATAPSSTSSAAAPSDASSSTSCGSSSAAATVQSQQLGTDAQPVVPDLQSAAAPQAATAAPADSGPAGASGSSDCP